MRRLQLSAGDYGIKVKIKKWGNKNSFPQEKGAAMYPGLQVEFPPMHCDMSQQLRVASVEGLAEVEHWRRLDANKSGFNIHETQDHSVKAVSRANWRR